MPSDPKPGQLASLIISIIILIVVIMLIIVICVNWYNSKNANQPLVKNPQAIAAAYMYNKNMFAQPLGAQLTCGPHSIIGITCKSIQNGAVNQYAVLSGICTSLAKPNYHKSAVYTCSTINARNNREALLCGSNNKLAYSGGKEVNSNGSLKLLTAPHSVCLSENNQKCSANEITQITHSTLICNGNICTGGNSNVYCLNESIFK
jgi:hypothetical protein